MNKRIEEIRFELAEMKQHESMKLFRLARIAESHRCSSELVNAIRQEAWALQRAELEVVLNPFVYATWKYAFR